MLPIYPLKLLNGLVSCFWLDKLRVGHFETNYLTEMFIELVLLRYAFPRATDNTVKVLRDVGFNELIKNW
jgi:hypothetical protein